MMGILRMKVSPVAQIVMDFINVVDVSLVEKGSF